MKIRKLTLQLNKEGCNKIIIITANNRGKKKQQKKKQNPLLLVRKRNTPTRRPPLVDEFLVPTVADRGVSRDQRNGS
jgi:hypothetical protein